MLSPDFWAQALWETLYMVAVSTVVSYAIGLPVGLLLVVSDKGGIRLQYGADFTVYTTENNALVSYTPKFQTRDMFQNEIDGFINCIKTGEKLPSHIDTVIVTAQMMQAIYDSAEQHREIVLE